MIFSIIQRKIQISAKKVGKSFEKRNDYFVPLRRKKKGEKDGPSHTPLPEWRGVVTTGTSDEDSKKNGNGSEK